MLERFITSLENAPMSVATWLAGFAGIVWIRCFLETFSSPNVSGYVASDLPTLLSYTLFYLGAALVTVLAVSTFTRVRALPMVRALLFLLPIMWLAPLIDLVHGGAYIGYFVSATPTALLHEFLIYLAPVAGSGVTIGLHIELGLLVLLLGGYVYLKTKNVTRAIVAGIVGYVVIFATVALPSVFGFLFAVNGVGGVDALIPALQQALVARDFFHPSEMYSAYRTVELLFAVAMAQVWYLITAVAGFVLLYRVRRDVALAVVRNIRPERLAHYVIAAILGGLIALAEGSKVAWSIFDVITIAVAALTITFAWLFAVTVNDIVDEPIDAISNKERPLVTGALTPSLMREVAFVSGVMTLVGALALGSYATFWILVFSAVAYVYSAPPLRLKRVPVLASAFIGIATLALVLLGFFLLSANQAFAIFPTPIAIVVFLFMTLLTNVRDFKDIEGDAAAGIWTVPTLLGERRARWVIGALCFVAFLLAPLFIPVPLLWVPSLIAGAAAGIGLVQGRSERLIFSLYFLYLASVVLILAFS